MKLFFDDKKFLTMSSKNILRKSIISRNKSLAEFLIKSKITPIIV